MKRKINGLFFLLFSISCGSLFAAPIKVGVVQSAPFAVLANNQFVGLSIDLWKTIAKEQNIEYQFVPLSNDAADGVEALENNKIDALLGPIIVTAPIIHKVSFSRPYFINQLALVTITPEHGF